MFLLVAGVSGCLAPIASPGRSSSWRVALVYPEGPRAMLASVKFDGQRCPEDHGYVAAGPALPWSLSLRHVEFSAESFYFAEVL